jgi:hypothetical protein
VYVFLFQIASNTVVVARCAVLFVLQSIAYVPWPLNFLAGRRLPYMLSLDFSLGLRLDGELLSVLIFDADIGAS